MKPTIIFLVISLGIIYSVCGLPTPEAEQEQKLTLPATIAFVATLVAFACFLSSFVLCICFCCCSKTEETGSSIKTPSSLVKNEGNRNDLVVNNGNVYELEDNLDQDYYENLSEKSSSEEPIYEDPEEFHNTQQQPIYEFQNTLPIYKHPRQEQKPIYDNGTNEPEAIYENVMK